MKKIFVFVFALMAINASSANLSIFDFNEEALNEEFSELTILESIVMGNPDCSFNTLNESVSGFDALQLNPEAQSFQNSFNFQWDGFLWGFCCCPVGLFVVATNKNKTKDQKTSYWIGVAGTIVRNLIFSALNTSAQIVAY